MTDRVALGRATLTRVVELRVQMRTDLFGQTPAQAWGDNADLLDPAFAPGTGTPEVGGLASWQAQGILRRLGGLAWAGMDLVEVSPPHDQAEITALAGATMAWEYLSLLAAA